MTRIEAPLIITLIASIAIGVGVAHCYTEFITEESHRNNPNIPSNLGSRPGGQLLQKDYSDIAIFGRQIR